MAFCRTSALMSKNSILRNFTFSPSVISTINLTQVTPTTTTPPTTTTTFTTTRRITLTACKCLSRQQHSLETTMRPTPTWKPTCLYFTQSKCTLMEDPSHLDKFNHNCSVPLEADVAKTEKLRPQNVDFLLVLDLEGKVEILEFPVMIIDTKTMQVVDFFHRFVRPSSMSEKRIEEYIEGKYGKLGVDRVWHDTAMPFPEVIQEFEAWITGHQLWEKELGGPLRKAAFVTCGNWDIKTKIPQQCQVCSMKIPPYFMEWINLKDIYLNFYNRRATGMRTMLNELKIQLLGSHHLGIDDTKNIVRIVQRMLADGAVINITARRNHDSPNSVDFLYKNRIR